MQACGPPIKVRRCPHTPGMLEIASGGLIHRSGLCSRRDSISSPLAHIVLKIAENSKKERERT